MANFFKNIFKSFTTFPDDEEDDDEEYDEYVNETEKKETIDRFRTVRNDSRENSFTDDVSKKPVSRSNVSRFGERQNKVVPIRSPKDLGVYILKPNEFSDCQDICDRLLNGKATVINLEGFDDELSQRLMDFVSGAVYVINGKLNVISHRIFIVAPEGVDISGDYIEFLSKNGIDAPNLIRDF